MAKILLIFLLLVMICLPTIGFTQSDTLSNPSLCGLEIPISDFTCPEGSTHFSPDLIPIRVTTAPGDTLGKDVQLVEVRIIIEHPWAGDLGIALLSPSLQTVTLSRDNGGNNNNFGNPEDSLCGEATRFTVTSCQPIGQGLAPFLDEPYQPEDPFRIFNDGLTPATGIWTLQLCDDVQADVGLLQYVELVFAPLNCAAPERVELLRQDSTAVWLDWIADGCTDSYVEFGPAGFMPGTDSTAGTDGLVVSTSCPPFFYGDLSENTTYDVYVRQACNSNFSANTCPIRFTTGCSPGSPSANYSFSSELPCGGSCEDACTLNGDWQNTDADNLDWQVWAGNTPTDGTGPDDALDSGGNYLYLETSGSSCANGAAALLYGPCLVLDKRGSDTCHLSFGYHMKGTQTGSLYLEVSDNGGASWDTLWSASGEQGLNWQKNYLSLSNYNDGDTLQMRFIGTKGNGPRGDIAIDEITFFGAQPLGTPNQIFYVDEDADGFGLEDDYINSCQTAPPPGYAVLAGDCNDQNAAIHPGANEIPCNGIDENCNLDTLQDDTILPSLSTKNDTVCNGEVALVHAQSNLEKFIFWYESPTTTSLLGFGDSMMVVPPENTGPDTLIYTVYAEETDFTCTSPRSAVNIVVLPSPKAMINALPLTCPGARLDLRSLPVVDNYFTATTITWYDTIAGQPRILLNDTDIRLETEQTFIARLTSAAGCSDEIVLTPPLHPRIDISWLPEDSLRVCRLLRDTVSVSASGGSGPISYQWSTGRTTPYLPIRGNFLPGTVDTFLVTAQDTLGCTETEDLLVYTTNSIDSLLVNVNDVSGCGGTDGHIELIPLDGTSPFAYRWEGEDNSGIVSGVIDTFILQNLTQGAYQVTITDSSLDACPVILRNLLVNGPDITVRPPTITPVSCSGNSNGEICLNVSGSSTPSFLWSTGDTTSCIDSLSVGSYAVTINGGVCNTILSNLEVSEPLPLSLRRAAEIPTCRGYDDGIAAVIPLGGTAPYAISWENGASSLVLNNQTSGNYHLTLTDANGCTLQDSVLIPAVRVPSIRVDSLQGVTCAGFEDAYLRVQAMGDLPPYTYVWENGSTGPIRTHLGPGSYAVTATDRLGCEYDATISIVDPIQLSADVLVNRSPVCLGDSTGKIVIRGRGGQAPYTYLWSDGSTADSLANLSTGNYSVTVHDANGCVYDDLTFSMNAMSTLHLSAEITEPNCVGLMDGRIEVSLLEDGPFLYSWEDGSNSPIRSGLGEGTYDLQVTDTLGCRVDTQFTIAPPQVINILQQPFSPSCPGGQDGLINTIVLNALSTPLTFQWNNGQVTADATGLSAGGYIVTVSDPNGCQLIGEPHFLIDPSPIRIHIDAMEGINCIDQSGGLLETTITGGYPPYDLRWSDGVLGTEDRYNLSPGMYRLQITDQRGCSKDTVFNFLTPTPLEVRVNVDAGPVCSPVPTTVITGVRGGTRPYNYNWSNGDTSPQLINPPTGEYSLTVTDAIGCSQIVRSIKVNNSPQPLRLDSFYRIPISCFGQQDGQLVAAVSGGSGRYRFQFNNTNCILDTTAHRVVCSGLGVDVDYRVTVIDRVTGCLVTSNTVPIVEPLPLLIRRDSVQNVNCAGTLGGAIYAGAYGGTMPYDFTWYDADGNIVGNAPTLDSIPSGTYSLNLTDAAGCTDSLSAITVTAPSDSLFWMPENSQIIPVACYGDSSGQIIPRIFGGVRPYQYAWNDGENTPSRTGLYAGRYTLTVTDQAGCSLVLPAFDITQPDSSIFLSAIKNNPTCTDSYDGSIFTNISGGLMPYRYSWFYEGRLLLGRDTSHIRGVQGGEYTLIVRDSLGCERSFDIDLMSPDTLSVTIELDTLGIGNTLIAVPSGGIAPYSFLWDNATADTTAQLEDVGNGLYTVTTTDQNDCLATAEFLITDVHSLMQDFSIKLFPNPTTGTFNLKWPMADRMDWRFTLYDSRGKAWKQFLRFGHEHLSTWSANELPPGIYLLVGQASDGRRAEARVVVAR